MVAKSKKTRARWDSEVEHKLIDIWVDILEELDGKMMTRKKKRQSRPLASTCTSPVSSTGLNSTRKRKSAARWIQL